MPQDAGLAEALLDLQHLTERLRRDCPWDREQTARTIVPHTLEEAYEVADAAAAGDAAKLVDELGDLLFQTYFLALLLEERGEGDLEAVARIVHEKLVRRHPHVFGDAEARTAGRVKERWEQIKTRGRRAAPASSTTCPSRCRRCCYARKVQRRAETVGYDWPDIAGPLAKLHEELRELEAEVDRTGEPEPQTEPDARLVDEVGDVLFTVVNVARRLNVDPELALRGATRKFRVRVERAIELADAPRRAVGRRCRSTTQERYYELRQGGPSMTADPQTSTPARSSTRAATPPSRSTSSWSPGRSGARQFPRERRPAPTKRSSCATAARAGAARASCAPSRTCAGSSPRQCAGWTPWTSVPSTSG